MELGGQLARSGARSPSVSTFWFALVGRHDDGYALLRYVVSLIVLVVYMLSMFVVVEIPLHGEHALLPYHTCRDAWHVGHSDKQHTWCVR